AGLRAPPRYSLPPPQPIPPQNRRAPKHPPRGRGAPPTPPYPPPHSGEGKVGGAPASDGNPRPATAPVPPRRPPQARTPAAAVGSRPPNAHPAAPVAVGEAPTDGAVTRPSGAGLPQ